jgi:septum formation protein
MNVILGSQSPRRKEILNVFLDHFETCPLNIDESYPETLPCRDVALFLAEKKFNAYANTLEHDILICADTVVIHQNRLLEKPKNRQEAIEMLRSLSGNTHQVITGVCLGQAKNKSSFSSETIVSFLELSESEIIRYVDAYNPFDKAGSYGIQEWIGYAAVESIQGCFYNVMGLPASKVYQALKSFGIFQA